MLIFIITNRLSLGVFDITSAKVLDWIENCSQAEFDHSGKYIYYVEADELNRPYQIRKRIIGSRFNQKFDTILHTDNDQTHYIDIGVSKDK